MQNKRRYVNFENGSHFICSLNLNSPELTVLIVFKITDIASGDHEIINSLISNSIVDNGKLKINAKHISFYKTHSGGLGLLISKAEVGAYVAYVAELTVLIVFKITDIASGDHEIINSLISNSIVDNGKLKINAKHISFYKTHSGGLGLLISKAEVGAYVAIVNDSSNLFSKPDSKFTSSKSNCTVLNKWHVISVTWSNKKNLSNCWSNGEKLMTFSSGDAKGSNYSFIGDLGRLNGSYKTYLTGCIGEIIGFYRSLTDEETSHNHKYLMKKWGITD